MRKLTKKIINGLTYEIIGAAIEVHREMGPGLLESIYEKCMVQELKLRGIEAVTQKSVPLFYKGIELDAELRYDLLVEDCIVVELKAVLKMIPIFEAQAMTYAKLLKVPKAILINFTCTNIFKEGQKTFVNEIFRVLPDH
ncbi:MAG: GxxExxY protein [Saprospiraceae bacterium]